jgi:predicted AAA+ superfamily ATPase
MQRNTIYDLINWKNDPNRKPLIIQGARQVGKTWLMKEFGRTQYKTVFYISFENNDRIQQVFSGDMDTRRIISELEAIQKRKISAADTLIIFDEIQECNRALVSLKYFCENSPEYNIIAAGSFLGVAIHSGNSFPVGKVDLLILYPLTFAEFLNAAGEDRLTAAVQNKDYHLIKVLKNDYIKYLKYYFYVGGMPEAVLSFITHKNLTKVRKIQKAILETYKKDFSKHIGLSSVPKVEMIWESLPQQLAKEKKKWVYNDMKAGARAREYEDAMFWLINCGLVYKVNRVTTPKLPLASYQEREYFKLYAVDIGLLSAMSSLGEEVFFDPDPAIFVHFKGALTEQYVLQELKAINDLPVSYWANDAGSAEVDFVIQTANQIIPVEVKATINLKAKSLKVYMESFKPKTTIRTSLVDYRQQYGIYEIPLYMIGALQEIVL